MESKKLISYLGELITPTKRIGILRDESDNRIPECALNGHADVIVTGDKDMLKLVMYKNVRIIRLKEYLESLE